MHLLIRSPQNGAKAFNILLLVFCLRFVLALILIPFYWGPYAILPVSLVVMALIGIVLYQMGCHPLGAALLAQALWIPYLSSVILFLVIVWARYRLQNENYHVGFMGARANTRDFMPMPPFQWKRQWGWLAVYLGIPFFVFVSLWILNPAYMGKFFRPLPGHVWLGPVTFLVAFLIPLFCLPLGLEIHRIRTTWRLEERGFWQILAMNALSLLLCIISTLLILFTPAFMTMLDQMSRSSI